MTNDDGPLFRHAFQRADDIDQAEQPAARRKAWVRFLAPATAAFAEGFLRNELMVGAVLFSIIVIGIGATSGDPAWTIGCIVSGVAGMVLVGLAWRRRWSFGRQWAVIAGVLMLQIAAMVTFWKFS
ncbi:MAG TPA: hypothetical protein VGR06_15300 [Actinophytocola sp.]|uniref:hypothetical protein n=1 Tax=Actinophytocola sp. TaxID=1872138 RepID=UPI002E0950A9|nr:hypothetical protein [Actinophytocola sp.]